MIEKETSLIPNDPETQKQAVELKRWEKWYEDNKENLLEKYGGKYIAVCDNTVIAVADSLTEVDDRVDEMTEYVNRVVYEVLVSNEPPKEYHFS